MVQTFAMQHRVTLTKDFTLMKHEVTQGAYQALMGENPSAFPSDSNYPVEGVSWYDAVAYANALSDKEGLTRCYSGIDDNIRWDRSCNGYRLPTEAEWEYAARAGQPTKYAGSDDADEVAWYKNNLAGKPMRFVKKANAWGFYDMSGNVGECLGLVGGFSGGVTDPIGPNSARAVSYEGAAGSAAK